MNTDGKPKDTRSLAMGLAFAAAACLIYAAFTNQWLVNNSRYIEVGFGLRNNSQCQSSFGSRADDDARACASMSNSAFIEQVRALGSEGKKQASAAFVPAGWTTLVVVLLAALGLLAAGGLTAARKSPDLPIAPTTISMLGLMIGLISGCVFVATKPGPPGMVGVGLSFWVFGIGCVMGIAASQMLAKLNRPPDPDWLVDAGGPPPS